MPMIFQPQRGSFALVLLWPIHRLLRIWREYQSRSERKIRDADRLATPPYSPLIPFDAQKCEASFMKVGRGAWQQKLVVHGFCTPEGRDNGCLSCCHCPQEYQGMNDRQYTYFKDTGERLGARTKQDLLDSKTVRGL